MKTATTTSLLFRRSLRLLGKYLAAFFFGIAVVFTLTLFLPEVTYQVSGGFATERVVEALRAELRLDRPPLERLVLFLRDLLSGEVRSVYTQEPLVGVLSEKARTSGRLLLASVTATASLTIVFFFALTRSRSIERVMSLALGVAASVPVFVTATILVFVCARLGMSQMIAGALSLGIFPSIVLSTNLHARWQVWRHSRHYALAVHYQVSRPQMLERMARELIPAAAIVFNTLIFFVTAGISIVETIFGLPGAGRWLLDSILRLDLPVVLVLAIAGGAVVCVLGAVNELFLLWGARPTLHERLEVL